MARYYALLFAGLSLGLSDPAFADGGHLGWCNGVGNPHQVSSCGGGTQPPTTLLPGSIPTANQIPGVAVPPTPMQVPVLAPVQSPSLVPTPTPGATPQMVPQIVAIPGQIPMQVPTPTPGATPQMVPQIVAVPGQVPMLVPTPTPGANPQMVPQIVAVPGQVPMQVPNATAGANPQMVPQIVAVPGQTPMLVPTPTPTATPMLVPRPKPVQTASIPSGTAGTITHSSTVMGSTSAKTQITAAPGRQAQHDAPLFAADDGGKPWTCLASGHGIRRSVVDGRVVVAGALRHVGAIDVLGRDLPALHPGRSDCLISVRRSGE